MTTLFGTFHICALFICCTAAVFSAWKLRRISSERIIHILFFIGIILLMMEIHKQIYITFIMNNGVYDWWFFPFQLCSVPMYLCILLPIIKGRFCDASLTFMACFTPISALAALIYPEDFLRPQLGLTLHGFIWHALLLFISFLIIFSKTADLSPRNFSRTCMLFAGCCIIAICINIISEALMASSVGIEHSYAAMFYMNPFHVSPQPIVGAIQKSTNIPFGLVLYALAIITVSGISCRMLKCFSRNIS